MILPIRFASTICVVSEPEFRKLPLRQMERRNQFAAPPWGIRDRVARKVRGYTEGAYVCNVGGIHNGKRLVLFHLLPLETLQVFHKVEKVLKEDIEALRKRGGSLKGILTGGDPRDEFSRRLFEKLEAFFTQHNIPTTLLWGQKGGGPLAVYGSPQEDRWILQGKHYDPKQGANAVPTELVDNPDLQTHFQTVKLAPGDKVVFHRPDCE